MNYGKCVITHVGINVKDPQRRRDIQKMIGGYLHRTGEMIQEDNGQVNVFDESSNNWLFSWKADKPDNNEKFQNLIIFNSFEKEYDDEGEEIGPAFEIYVRKVA